MIYTLIVYILLLDAIFIFEHFGERKGVAKLLDNFLLYSKITICGMWMQTGRKMLITNFLLSKLTKTEKCLTNDIRFKVSLHFDKYRVSHLKLDIL